jgi:dihydrodipicolinate reductase
MKIALCGYGKMGHEIEFIARARGHEIAALFDIDKPLSPEALKATPVDVVIDFTQPDAVVTNAGKRRGRKSQRWSPMPALPASMPRISPSA